MGIVNITAVCTSNLQRAVQTASILDQQAGLGPVCGCCGVAGSRVLRIDVL